MKRFLLTLVSASGLAACTSHIPDQIAKPGDITLEEALKDVVRGFYEAQAVGKSLQGKPILGVSACTVTVSFNVAATTSQSGKLFLDATIKTPAPVNVGLTGSAEQVAASNASRGNTVTMVLTSPACLPPNTSGALMAANVGKPSGSQGAGGGHVIPIDCWKGVYDPYHELFSAVGTSHSCP